MFERRLAGAGSLSPPSLPHQLSTEGNSGRRRPSVIDDSEGRTYTSPDTTRIRLILQNPVLLQCLCAD